MRAPGPSIRYYFHGDITPNGRFWYSARGDVFMPLPLGRGTTPSDVRRMRRMMQAMSEEDMEREGLFRPLDTPNLFMHHDLALLSLEELDARLADWMRDSEYAESTRREWDEIGAQARRWGKNADLEPMISG